MIFSTLTSVATDRSQSKHFTSTINR